MLVSPLLGLVDVLFQHVKIFFIVHAGPLNMLESGFSHFPQALSLLPFYLLQSIKVLSAHLKCQCAISVYKCSMYYCVFQVLPKTFYPGDSRYHGSEYSIIVFSCL